MPSAAPSAPNASGSSVWLAFSIVVRTPTTSPWRPAGEAAYSSAMIIGWAQPRPMPSRNESAMSSGTWTTNGNSEYALPEIMSATVTTVHSRTRRASTGITRRTANVAAANEPITIPMVVAERPILEPWMGMTKVYRSHPIASRPLAINAARSRGSRSRSTMRRSPVSARGPWPCGSPWRFRKSSPIPAAGKTASRRKAVRWLVASIANPASSGPKKPPTEKPSENQLKFTARSAAVPIAPTAWLSATWYTMNEVPISVAAT